MKHFAVVALLVATSLPAQAACLGHRGSLFCALTTDGNHANERPRRPQPPQQINPYSQGVPVYRSDECAGTIVAGVCHGTVIPKQAYRPRCYGQMLNGVCTGTLQ